MARGAAQAAELSDFDLRLWVADEGPVSASAATAQQAMGATYTTSGTSIGLVPNASSRSRRRGSSAVVVALYSAQDAFAADCAFTEPEFVMDGKPQHGGISYLSAAGGAAAASKQPLSLQKVPLQPISGAERMKRSLALAPLLTSSEFPNARQALKHLLLENPSTYTIKDAAPPPQPAEEEDYFAIPANFTADTPGASGQQPRRQEEGNEPPAKVQKVLQGQFDAAADAAMEG